ncbi:MAG: hypothetical protein LC620_07855 [Halobacteriales archaeon]|nr:hypothetical protein [Halobacteriales archaeon]
MAYPWPLARLNPAQHRLFARHVERAAEVLREGDRLLRGAVADVVERCIAAMRAEAAKVDQGASTAVRFDIASIPLRLLHYVEDPFAQSLAFNLHCQRTGASHTQATRGWEGGAAAVAARNLVFLPPIYQELWSEGLIDKTRLVGIANRNLTPKAYLEIADLVRSRRKEDVDERLLRLPAASLQPGRRGPGEAIEAARANGWMERLRSVEVPAELVVEAGRELPDEAPTVVPVEAPVAGDEPVVAPPPSPLAPVRDVGVAETAQRTLRAGLSGARLAPEVVEALALSPDPQTLVERFLTAHRKTGDPDPGEVTKTIFFAHAGPMQRLVADDKLLLRHFRPVKTQKRGQLFYRLLEVIEEAMLERNHTEDLGARGLTEPDAMVAVRKVLVELNRDPNRFLVIPDEWLGEVTRRHLYFGSRTRKEGAAYKWYRKLGPKFYLGAHKTEDELTERAARRGGLSIPGTTLVDPSDDEE